MVDEKFLGKDIIVDAGKNRDRNEFCLLSKLSAVKSFSCSLHHLDSTKGMEVGDFDTKFTDLFHGLLHGVWNVT